MYKNKIIKWAEKSFNEQFQDCFEKYDNKILDSETDETYAGGFWDLASDMYAENPTGMEQDTIYYLLTDYYDRVQHNKTHTDDNTLERLFTGVDNDEPITNKENK